MRDDRGVPDHRDAAVDGGKTKSLYASKDGDDPLEQLGDYRIAAARHENTVEVIVGLDGFNHSTVANGLGEASIGRLESLQVLGRQMWCCEPGRELMYRRRDLLRADRRLQIYRGYDREAAWLCYDEARALKSKQGFTDRRTTDTQPGLELGVPKPLTGCERPVYDRITEGVVCVVTQERATMKTLGRGDRHA